MTERRLFTIFVAALLLSLAANVFFGGVYFGGWHGGGYGSSGREACYRHMDDRMKKELSESDRAILKSAMEANKPRFRQMREELQAARGKVEQAMRADPLDRQALESALEAQEDAEEDMRALVHDVRRNTAEKLSPEGRRVFARHMREKDEKRFGFRPPSTDREQRNPEAPVRPDAP